VLGAAEDKVVGEVAVVGVASAEVEVANTGVAGVVVVVVAPVFPKSTVEVAANPGGLNPPVEIDDTDIAESSNGGVGLA
jgi:hypothetical protein